MTQTDKYICGLCHGQQRPWLTSRKHLESEVLASFNISPEKKVVMTAGTQQHLQMNPVPTNVIGTDGPHSPGGARLFPWDRQ